MQNNLLILILGTFRVFRRQKLNMNITRAQEIFKASIRL